MDHLSRWLSWQDDAALHQDFLSTQFSVLCKDGVPSVLSKPIFRPPSKDKDKKKKQEQEKRKKEEKKKEEKKVRAHFFFPTRFPYIFIMSVHCSGALRYSPSFVPITRIFPIAAREENSLRLGHVRLPEWVCSLLSGMTVVGMCWRILVSLFMSVFSLLSLLSSFLPSFSLSSFFLSLSHTLSLLLCACQSSYVHTVHHLRSGVQS